MEDVMSSVVERPREIEVDNSRLTLQVLICGSSRTLRLAGELDLASRASLEDAISRLVASRCLLTLDLRLLTFMDATGVHVALAASDLCAAHACELRLVPGPAPVQRVFSLAGVIDHLPFRADPDQSGLKLSGADSEDGAALGRFAARAGQPRRESSLRSRAYSTHQRPSSLGRHAP
jgi:anti-anti-sigma factor